jgi:hypothetical protein
MDDEPLVGVDDVALTPEQYGRLKEHLFRDSEDLLYSDERYLVNGAGEGAKGERRDRVAALLDDREGATAFRLEDVGIGREDADLWAPAFEVLCGRATWIVTVIEDFDGGYVWELGVLYDAYDDKTWVLRRVYPDEEEHRRRYDDGMAASHVANLAIADRRLEWEDEEELEEAVDEIP